jgi:hypothetical protein
VRSGMTVVSLWRDTELCSKLIIEVSKGVYSMNSNPPENPPELEDLQLGESDTSLESRLSDIIENFVGIFRQSIATEGFKAGPFTLKNVDLQRVHRIVNEIDSRRVFYTRYEEEGPPYALASINQARDAIRQSMNDVWADSSQERLVQQIQVALNDFVTQVERIEPFPANYAADNFSEFEEPLVDLRLKIWSIVAALKIKNGHIIQPMHLPDKVLHKVSRATSA